VAAGTNMIVRRSADVGNTVVDVEVATRGDIKKLNAVCYRLIGVSVIRTEVEVLRDWRR